jgi:hypothetical protein
MASVASQLRFFIVAKLCPLWGKSKSCLPKSWQIIAHLLPLKDQSHAPFPPLPSMTLARWNRYARIHHSLFVRLPVSTFRQCVAKARQVHGKKLDINNDGMIILEELTSRRDKRFQILDLNGDGMIDKTESNGRFVTMFEKIDSNGDGSLDDKEIIKMKRHNYDKTLNSRSRYSH